MDTKKFTSAIKGFRTRFTKTPNKELELKSVTTCIEKMGGAEVAFAALEGSDLIDYIKGVMGIKPKEKSKTKGKKVAPSAEAKPATPPTEKMVKEKKKGKSFTTEDGKQLANIEGVTYEVDDVKKTVKKVYHDFSELTDLDVEALNETELSMKPYKLALKDKFSKEDAPIKDGVLWFRGYRIYCNIEKGFVIEDTTTKPYTIIDTPFEGIPTPKELCDFFNKPIVTKTDEELAVENAEAAERGKKLAEDRHKKKEVAEVEEVDYEKLRRKVLRQIVKIRNGSDPNFDPAEFLTMIPFKRWRKAVKGLLEKWQNKEIRYRKFLNELETITTEETFVIEEKKHRSAFKGTMMPDHKTVGNLVGNKIEVDGKMVDAVPFIMEYLLNEEPRAMSQIMKFGKGEITALELIQNPMEVDWKVEYNKRAVENTAENARILSIVCYQCDVIPPQDLLYEADVKVGDKILLLIDGEMRTRTISSTEHGIVVGRNVGIMKSDLWIKKN